MPLDIVIRHAKKIVTMDDRRSIIDDGAIAIENGAIVDIGPDEIIRGKYAFDVMIDGSSHAVLPGLIDTHGHAGHGLIKTLAESNDDWNELVSALYTKYTNSEFWKTEGMLSALERIRFGTTTGVSFFGGGAGAFRVDDPRFAQEYSASIESIGLRGLLGIGPSGRSFPFNPVDFSGDGNTTAIDFSSELKNVSSAIMTINSKGTIQKACVALNTIAPKIISNPIERNVIKEQSRALRDTQKNSGTVLLSHGSGGSISLAKELDLLGPDVSLAHCAGLGMEEVEILASTKTRVIHCPRARSIIKARCPVRELLDHGVIVSIGTDGNSPDRTFNLFDDMRMALSLSRTFFADSHVLSPGKVLEMVTIDAARVIGMEKQIGSLEKGKRADLILLNLKRPHLVPLIGMTIPRLVYEATGSDVETVIVDGKIRMLEDKIVEVNEEEILEKSERVSRDTIERAGYEKYLKNPDHFWGATRY